MSSTGAGDVVIVSSACRHDVVKCRQFSAPANAQHIDKPQNTFLPLGKCRHLSSPVVSGLCCPRERRAAAATWLEQK
jgi:hypothetical protein